MAGLFGRSRVPLARTMTDWRPRGRREGPRSARERPERRKHRDQPDQRDSRNRAPRDTRGPGERWAKGGLQHAPAGPLGPGGPRRRRRGPVRAVRTVAGQVFVLQVGVVLLLVVAAVVALVLQSRYDSEREARNRSLAVAESFASAPGIVAAMRGPDPTAELQPLAERAREGSGVDFIVAMSPDGIRYTHPNPHRIGKHFMGSIGPAVEGRTLTETFTGTLGLSVRSVVPVFDERGKVVGLVSAGITIKKVSGAADHQLPLLFGAAAAALALATAGTALVSRRLRRQTHGLDPAEMTRMYEHHDAVLHAVREGVLIVGGDGRLVLANDEARRLFDLPPDAEGRPVAELGFDPHTAALLTSGRPATDEVHTAGERLLSVSHRPTDRNGGPPGSVATLRDTTELRALSGKVDLARERLKLLYDAGVSIGTTLDVVRTAQELAEYAVARFADYVSVDLADSVLRGEEPQEGETGTSTGTSTATGMALGLPVPGAGTIPGAGMVPAAGMIPGTVPGEGTAHGAGTAPEAGTVHGAGTTQGTGVIQGVVLPHQPFPADPAAGPAPSADGGRPTSLRRSALSGIRDGVPLYPVGMLIQFGASAPQARGFRTGAVTVEPVLSDFGGWQEQDPEHARRIVEFGIHSMITVPLRARGVVLGVASFMRSEKPEPFEEDDVSLAEELVTRAAVSIDNARRYTREHTMAVTLQRSLLPRVLPEQDALDVAYRYLPAESGVGGDWFDVIPLPGARVALVVGDVVGHGLHAAATMGRLRTAVHNFSTLDLPPDEILSHLDDLIARIDQDERGAGAEGTDGGTEVITGATCLYAIYDPVTRRCTMARAGHPPPAVVCPDGSVEFPDLPAGPPLGLGGLPFETAELELPEGSHLVLYTDGLIEKRDRDIDIGLELLRDALSHPGRTPEESCTAVLDALLPDRPSDDIALIVARTRVLEQGRIANCEVPSDPAHVAEVRAAVARKLAEWELGDVAFTTELILSELITNAIRYATGPIRVRLLCDRSLICEVSDTSSTSPHLRYAATTDEGGRGLFLVSQFADRWGTRYTTDGKVIWAELALPQQKNGKRS
ncbi:SpoIIE family protein phosphatase/ATP-binding protein [Streptomyces sp. NA02950]|uniref:SpoIIE family protein phosphatase/ATP-binding protein n=1 Tax=Streptomyces sp. NA02950 TaxID=2742137 RepID=UPI0020CB3009|nr:SpoIIE family protein phosphatase/ATP-binding protein [Streptomyces sp. NA02950]